MTKSKKKKFILSNNKHTLLTVVRQSFNLTECSQKSEYSK